MRRGDEPTADTELIRRALEGEVRALDRLLDRHQGRVLRVLRLLGVPPQEREDVAQEVFIRVIRHLGGFRRSRPFEPWLYRICVNAVHDQRSRSYRREAGEVPLEADAEPPGPANSAEAVERRELRARLERALAGLSERERAVFVLREIEGLETHSVAKVLGITRVTVRRHLGRARERLRSLLEEQEKA